MLNQYLRDARLPVLEYKLSPEGVAYRFANCQRGFTMPVRLCLNEVGPRRLVMPTTAWQTLPQPAVKALTVDADYYVLVRQSQ